MTQRKVIQIATMPSGETIQHGVVPAAIYALCDDSTMWALNEGHDWKPVKAIPQEPKDV